MKCARNADPSPSKTIILTMPKNRPSFAIRAKIWIEDDTGKVVFGRGRYRILDAIDRLGSLQSAAKELKMSYRAVWCRIKASEERIGAPLVERVGNGSKLTPYAENLMKQYKRLRRILLGECDDVFADLMADLLNQDEASRKRNP
jgi:molybdate transport system regulatory protein